MLIKDLISQKEKFSFTIGIHHLWGLSHPLFFLVRISFKAFLGFFW